MEATKDKKYFVARYMVLMGAIILIVTFFLIIKKYDVKLVLLLAGILMTILGGDIWAGFNAFTSGLTGEAVVPIITMSMGFSYVLKLTKCDLHLINFITKPMAKFQLILIPLAVIVTSFINIAITSAAAVGAAVGAIFIPALIKAGVSPAVAAAAILAGTFASTISPGAALGAHASEVTGIPIIDLIAYVTPYAIVTILIAATSLLGYAILRKEHKGYVPTEEELMAEEDGFKPSVLKALVPLIPLILLVVDANVDFLGTFYNADGELVARDLTVPQSMLIGTFLACLISWKNPQEVTKAFFDGLGSSFGKIIGLIVAAGVFTTGMDQIGITGAIIDAMQASDAMVSLAGVFGSFLFSVISGSGIAAALAFNGAITPYAADFGLDPRSLATFVQLAANIGRSMSPIAGITIIVAGVAKVNPIEVAKRNTPGMIIATVFLFIMLLL